MRTSRRRLLGTGIGFAGSAALFAACGQPADPMADAPKEEALEAKEEEKPRSAHGSHRGRLLVAHVLVGFLQRGNRRRARG